MTKRSTHTPQRHLHSLARCVWCGSRKDLYTAFVYTLDKLAAQCEDPIGCLRRRKKKAGT